MYNPLDNMISFVAYWILTSKFKFLAQKKYRMELNVIVNPAINKLKIFKVFVWL